MGQSQAICSFTCEFIRVICLRGLPYGPAGKDSTFNVGDTGDASSIPWVGKVPWRRKWQPTPVCLPEKSCRQRSLVGYSPWGRKESDVTERLSTQANFYNILIWNSNEKKLLLNERYAGFNDQFLNWMQVVKLLGDTCISGRVHGSVVSRRVKTLKILWPVG